MGLLLLSSKFKLTELMLIVEAKGDIIDSTVEHQISF